MAQVWPRYTKIIKTMAKVYENNQNHGLGTRKGSKPWPRYTKTIETHGLGIRK